MRRGQFCSDEIHVFGKLTHSCEWTVSVGFQNFAVVFTFTGIGWFPGRVTDLGYWPLVSREAGLASNSLEGAKEKRLL